MKRVAIALCFLLMGCSPNIYMVKDSYNTYAPTYSPYSAPVYSPIQTTYTTMQPQKVKKVKIVRKYRVIPSGGAY